jgi:hypothetical protein
MELALNGGMARMRRGYRRLRAYLGRPILQIQDRPVILDDRDYCPNPIFIIGLHRSGTSLLRRVVNAHSRIACPPETFFLRHFANMIEDDMTFEGLSGMGLRKDTALREVAKQASRFHEAFRRCQNKARWADKTPQYIAILDQVNRMFPSACYLAIVRHPFDVCDSIYRKGWRFGDYAHDIFENTVLYVAASLQRQLEFTASRSHACHLVRYEDLVQSPEPVTRRIFDFLGEPWEPQVLDFADAAANFGKEDTLVRGLRTFQLSYGNWIGFDKAQLRLATDRLGRFVERLGYSYDPSTPPAM